MSANIGMFLCLKGYGSCIQITGGFDLLPVAKPIWMIVTLLCYNPENDVTINRCYQLASLMNSKEAVLVKVLAPLFCVRPDIFSGQSNPRSHSVTP